MDSIYLFETETFAVSKNDIHLLRNNYKYKTLSFSEIKSIEVSRQKELKNWIWVLIIGIGLIAFAVYYSALLIGFFLNPEYGKIEVRMVVVPVLPYILGIYTLVISLRNGYVLNLKGKSLDVRFPLRKLKKENSLDDFLLFLSSAFPSATIKI